MRVIITGIVALIASLAPAMAQSSSDPSQQAQPQASENPAGSASLKTGANSFAEGQARALLESKGFRNVSALMNDRQGIWRGTAMRGDDRLDVSVDFQGKIEATAHNAGNAPLDAREVKP